jgi:hypothetical protein
MERTEGNGLEDEHVEGALQKFQLFILVHGDHSPR